MITFEKAILKILQTVRILDPVEAPFNKTLGLVSAENIKSGMNIPPFANSAMDGFAVKASDIKNASEKNPVKLKIIETVRAGKSPRKKVISGTAVKIMTGAPVPEGADTIVMKEYTDSWEADNNRKPISKKDPGKKSKSQAVVTIFKAVKRGSHIRKQGEDFKEGKVLIKKWKTITPAYIGFLASIGRKRIKVIPECKIGIFVTGDELLEPSQYKIKNSERERPVGKIFNSNSHIISAMTEQYGAEAVNLGIIKDNRKSIERAIRAAMKNDIIISTGGVSVGEYDLVKEVLDKLGFKKKIWGVSIKPGKPFLFGTIQGKPYFGLPGNPVSAMVAFELFVKPAILKMSGHAEVREKEIISRLGNDIISKTDRLHLIRARTNIKTRKINGKKVTGYFSESTGFQGSANISSISEANSLIKVPPEKKHLKKGEEVEVILF